MEGSKNLNQRVVFQFAFLTTEALSSQRNTEIIPVQLSVTVSPWFYFNFKLRHYPNEEGGFIFIFNQ